MSKQLATGDLVIVTNREGYEGYWDRGTGAHKVRALPTTPSMVVVEVPGGTVQICPACVNFIRIPPAVLADLDLAVGRGIIRPRR